MQAWSAALSSARVKVRCALLGLAVLLADPSGAAQSGAAFVPVGVRYRAAADPAERQKDLLDMHRLRFTVVELVAAEGLPDRRELARLDRMLAGDTTARANPEGVVTIAVTDRTPGSDVWHKAWRALAHGSRGVLFDDWAALERNPSASTTAAEFAGHMSRNAALYAPLQPRRPAARPDVTIDGGRADIEVAFLESAEALVMIVLNTHSAEPRSATLTFAPDMPEAIWQNMLTGGAVNFVAGPDGPTYAPALEPSGVLVLMIRKTWR